MTSPNEASPEVLLAHGAWLRDLARRLVLDDAEADDAVQETWLAVLERRGEAPRSPRAWLAGVLRHVVANRRRGAARARHREQEKARGAAGEQGPDALESLVLVERQRALLDLVLALPEPQRRALVLRFFDGLPPRAIAAREGASVDTIKSRLQRGLARLREELDRAHGDRRAWGLWLLPLAREGPASLVPGLGVLGAGLAAVAGAAVLALVLLPRAGREPVEGLARSAGEVARAGDAPALAQEPDARTPASSAAAPAGQELLVRVVDDRTGAPLAGALVMAVDASVLVDPRQILAKIYPDVERMALELGQRALTDAGGLARFKGSAPWMVHASRGELVGLAAVEMSLSFTDASGGRALDVVGADQSAAELVARLRAMQPTRVRVVDERGVPQAGVPIAGGYEVAIAGEAGPPHWWHLGRTSDEQGEALFHDPLGLSTASAEERERRSILWRDLRIDLPGFSERSGRARWRGGEPPEAPVRLQIGPAGSLELRIVDGAGEVVPYEGRAWLSALEGGQPAQRYEASLEGGRAIWPRVAPGGRYRAKIALPDEGAEWTVEGAGPAAAGARALVETRRPERPALVAWLVDAEGAAVHTDRVTVYLPAKGYPRILSRLSSDAQGRLRIELDAPLVPLLEPGVEWAATVTVHGFEGVRWARAALPESSAAGETSLGRLVLAEAPQPLISGRCVGPDGQPLAGVDITARQLTGMSSGAYSDRRGRFRLSGIFGERTKLEVRDYEGGWFLPAPLDVSAGDGEVLVQLVRAGTFRSRLRVGALGHHAGLLGARLVDEGGKTLVFARPTAEGEIFLEKVRPGLSRFELCLRNLTLVACEGILVAPGEEARDPRVDGLDLETLLREVRLSVTGIPAGERVRVAVVAGQDGVASLELGDGRLPLPRGLAGELLVGAAGMRTRELGPLASLPDVVEVALQPGFLVELRPHGSLLARGPLLLELAGDPLETVVSLPAKLAQGEPVTLRLPAPGTYRLLRQVDSAAGGGMVLSGREPTGIELEIVESGDLQMLEIDLQAAR